MSSNEQTLTNSFQFLRQVVYNRLQSHFKNTDEAFTQIKIEDDGTTLNTFIISHQLGFDEYIILLMALVAHVQVSFFENIIQEFLPQGGDFPEFGGVKGSNHRGLLPTGETAQFVLAGNDIAKRVAVQQLITGGMLAKQGILYIEAVKEGEPPMSGRLMLDPEWVSRLVTGEEIPPKFNPDFPAKKITTAMTWDDLVLSNYTQRQLNDMIIWVQHNTALMQDEVMKRKVKPGYRSLFHGPPGTGKTLTATLLGNHLNKDVYRVDLSQVVSKYIGETEKNLEKVFIKAENKDWILLFDEADALFGKRTSVQNSHDRYANQEVSYLLQRIEDYPGLIVLASNFKSNMDEAFLRRFNNVIHFSTPNAAERLSLWQKTLPPSYKAEPTLNLKEMADKYELNGAAILNIVHYAALQSISRGDEYIRHADLLEAIRKEYRKEDRTFS